MDNNLQKFQKIAIEILNKADIKDCIDFIIDFLKLQDRDCSNEIEQLIFIVNKINRIETNIQLGLMTEQDHEQKMDQLYLKIIKFISHINEPSAVVYLWNTQPLEEKKLKQTPAEQKANLHQIKQQAQYLFKTGDIETILLFLEEQLMHYPELRSKVYMEFGKYKILEKLLADKRITIDDYLAKITKQLQTIEYLVNGL